MHPFTFVLHSDREDLHDLIAGQSGDFANTTSEMADAASSGANVQVQIPVHYRTFGRLKETVTLAAILLRQEPDLSGLSFQPKTNAGLAESVDRFLEELAKRLEEFPISLVVRREDPLFEIMGRLKGAVGHESDADVLRLFGAITGGVYWGPRVFHLDISNRCNTDCVYCWFHSKFSTNRKDAHLFDDAWRSQMLDWNLFKNLIDDLAEMGTTEDIVLSGKGEPLVHPRILDMVRYIRKKNLAMTLFTNGILLSEEVSRVLIESEVDLLYVSLSAHDSENYKALRVNPPDGEFDRIVKGLKTLARLKREMDSTKPELVLVSILTRHNVGGVVEFARLAKEVGADHLRYQLAAIEHYNQDLRIAPEQFAQLKNDMDTVKEITRDAGIQLVANIDFQLDHVDDGSQNWAGEYFLEKGCYAGWLFSRVWADGTSSFCCVPKPVGQLSGQRFRELWNSQFYNQLRLDAKDIAHHQETLLKDGSRLWDDRCHRCPNYEQIQWLFDLAGRLQVDQWLK